MGGGHGHGDHHHHRVLGECSLTRVPDYRKYKVSDVPELVIHQRLLAQKGLKDPWARNLVWAYKETDPWFVGRNLSSQSKFARNVFRGFHYGVAFCAIHLTLEAVYNKFFASEDDHGHH